MPCPPLYHLSSCRGDQQSRLGATSAPDVFSRASQWRTISSRKSKKVVSLAPFSCTCFAMRMSSASVSRAPADSQWLHRDLRASLAQSLTCLSRDLVRVPPCADVAVSIPPADHVGRFERSEQLRTDLRYLSHVVCAIRGNVVQTHLRILLDHPTWRESDVGAHVGDFVVQRTCPDVRISLPLNVWPAQASLVDDSTFLCGRTDTIAAVMAAGLPPAPARCCAASVSQLADVHLPAAAARQLQAAGSALAELRRPLLSSRQRLVACADVLPALLRTVGFTTTRCTPE